MNETRKGVLNVLKGAKAPMTLNEVAEAMGVEKVGTGTTNTMVQAGLIRVAGKRKVAKTVYVEVNTYELATPEAE